MIHFLRLQVHDYLKVSFDKKAILFTYTYKGTLLENRDLDKKINLPLWPCLWDEHAKRN